MSIDLDALVQTMRITAIHMAPVVLMPHEARALVAEVERLRAEVVELRGERAAVVAWLRSEADAFAGTRTEQGVQRAMSLALAADNIERGEHRRKETK